ncbi:MAG TPA: hypothetical protein VMD53_19105 [Rhizomicrobium sp.]|nr:hypothetical protein [Rhizomicrobium sp.]
MAIHGRSHIFGVFHWLAVVALALALVGRYAASHQNRAVWAYIHPISMVLSYYVVVGGLINEIFGRVAFFRAMAIKSAAGAVHRANAPIVQTVQIWAIAATIVLIVYFLAKVARYRSAARA